MSRYRSRLEIVRDVLSAVQHGSDKPTHIMYAANLSYRLGQDVLGSLVQHGLLREEEVLGKGRNWKRYVVTEKGLRMMRKLEMAREMMNIRES